jgi:hypothetical protein
MEYGHYMNKATKVRILELLMYYIEDNTNTESDHMQLKSELIIKSGAGVNIVLDKLPQHLCVDIYNIIYRRMEILNSPLTENTLQPRGSEGLRGSDRRKPLHRFFDYVKSSQEAIA